MQHLYNLNSSVDVPDNKIIYPYTIEHNIMTDDKCYSCTRPVSYCFSNLVGVKKWYCGYCATYIVRADPINSLEQSLQNLNIH